MTICSDDTAPTVLAFHITPSEGITACIELNKMMLNSCFVELRLRCPHSASKITVADDTPALNWLSVYVLRGGARAHQVIKRTRSAKSSVLLGVNSKAQRSRVRGSNELESVLVPSGPACYAAPGLRGSASKGAAVYGTCACPCHECVPLNRTIRCKQHIGPNNSKAMQLTYAASRS